MRPGVLSVVGQVQASRRHPAPHGAGARLGLPTTQIQSEYRHRSIPPSLLMKMLSSFAALLALAALPALADDKGEAKPEAKPAAEPAKSAEAAKPAEPAKEKKPQASPEERFKKLDKDGNGSLSLDEFRGKKSAEEASEAFKKLDTNGDGSLSLEEFSAAGKKKGKKDKN